VNCDELAVVHHSDQERNVDVLFTRISLSPTCGTGAFSFNFSESNPVLPSTVHCLVVVGAMLIELDV